MQLQRCHEHVPLYLHTSHSSVAPCLVLPFHLWPFKPSFLYCVMEDLPGEAPARHGQRRHGFSQDEEHGEQMSEETSQEDVHVDLGHVQAGDH